MRCQDRNPRVNQRMEIVHEFEGVDLDVVAGQRAIERAATGCCIACADRRGGREKQGWRIK